ncbi:hypothetical protein [Methanocaldococcus sp.]
MRLYIYLFSISCLIGSLYCILITLYQKNVIILTTIGLFMALFSILTLNKKFSKLFEKLEICFMIIVLILFAYTLYSLKVLA